MPKHYDEVRRRGYTSITKDWRPHKRQGERIRGDDGVFELEPDGKEKIHGSKKGKRYE
jgi:hypothetical protein